MLERDQIDPARRPKRVAGSKEESLPDSRDLFASNNLVRLRALLALDNVELDIIAFLEAFIAINLDGTVMDEDIRSVVPPDETISLCVIEPLNLAFMLSHEPLTFLTADCGWR
jgi:hypothetical protein